MQQPDLYIPDAFPPPEPSNKHPSSHLTTAHLLAAINTLILTHAPPLPPIVRVPPPSNKKPTRKHSAIRTDRDAVPELSVRSPPVVLGGPKKVEGPKQKMFRMGVETEGDHLGKEGVSYLEIVDSEGRFPKADAKEVSQPIKPAQHDPLDPVPQFASPQQRRPSQFLTDPNYAEPRKRSSSAPTSATSEPTSKHKSLPVCEECESTLLECYEHCLTIKALELPHSRAPPTLSLKSYDNPTSFRHESHGGHDHTSHLHGRASLCWDGPSNAGDLLTYPSTHPEPKNRTTHRRSKTNISQLRTGRVFRGTLYRSVLAAARTEIRKLREKVYDVEVAERKAEESAEKLRRALARSLKYECAAEAWQFGESRRLLEDARYLKGEIAAVLAFLVHCEHEKVELMKKYDEMKAELDARDKHLESLHYSLTDLQHQLKESTSEFAGIHARIAELKHEATHGSDAVRSRNATLQSSLDKLSRDFELSSKELQACTTKIAELEFEHSELQYQLNTTAQARKQLERENIQLAREVDAVKAELRAAKGKRDAVYATIVEREAELKSMMTMTTSSEDELGLQKAQLAAALQALMQGRSELEGSLQSYKAENERLSNGIKSMSRTKDMLEAQLRSTLQRNDKDIANRDARIKEIEELSAQDQKRIANSQEEKEQLIFQITDLQNAVDRESSNANMLTFEIRQLKRVAEERLNGLKNELELLGSTKAALIAEKKRISDQIKSERADLAAEEAACEGLEAAMEKNKRSTEQKVAEIEKATAELTSQHEQLMSDHKTLRAKHDFVMETNAKLLEKESALTKEKEELHARLKQLYSELEESTAEDERERKAMEEAEAENKEKEAYLLRLADKANELRTRLIQTKKDTETGAADREAHLDKLDGEIVASMDHRDELIKQRDELSKKIEERLKVDLARTKAELDAETRLSRRLKRVLDSLEIELVEERKVRMQLERTHTGEVDDWLRKQRRRMERDQAIASGAMWKEEEDGSLDDLSAPPPGSDGITLMHVRRAWERGKDQLERLEARDESLTKLTKGLKEYIAFLDTVTKMTEIPPEFALQLPKKCSTSKQNVLTQPKRPITEMTREQIVADMRKIRTGVTTSSEKKPISSGSAQ
ncbi:hypothetical protein BJ742DRAFT_850330 [Cladochytrium replicatum]|nr:hypothetical protein BJ742DRAFT_850330 [Cladochytrium replicatum]